MARRVDPSIFEALKHTQVNTLIRSPAGEAGTAQNKNKPKEITEKIWRRTSTTSSTPFYSASLFFSAISSSLFLSDSSHS